MSRILATSVVLFALLAGMPLAVADAKLDAVRAELVKRFEILAPENINPSPIDGWYEVQKGPIIAYVSADGRYLLQGDLIDLELNRNLSDASREQKRRNVLANLDANDTIRFTPDEVKHRVTVFTDVDCTYCRKLHDQIEDYMAHGIEVRYLLYPRNGAGSRAWGVSENVWCARDRGEALTAAKADRSFESVACDASTVQEHYMLGQQMGLSGTPAIVLEDGTLIAGYLPPDALSQRLEQTTAAVR